MANRIIFCFGMLTLLFVISTSATQASAAASVSLPLEGYYRPGRYMPVRIVTAGGDAPVFLRASGAVTTRFEPAGSGDVIVPWLIVSENPTGVRWTSRTDAAQSIQPPLRSLNEDERLVAVVGVDLQIASTLFPGKKVIPITPDTPHGFLEPPQAWQSLDGIVLGSAAAAQLTSAQLQTLLAGGTTIAIASSDKPDSQWPWTRLGDLWVLRPVDSAMTFGIDPEAYTPTYNWDRGQPAAFRSQVVFAGALFCILGTAVALWRSRHAVWGFIALCGVSIVLIAGWSARRSPVLEKSVEKTVWDHGLGQYDRWVFHASLRPLTFGVPASGQGLAGPVFASGRQMVDLNMELKCDPGGTGSQFQLHLEPGQSIAFFTRVIRPDSAHLDYPR